MYLTFRGKMRTVIKDNVDCILQYTSKNEKCNLEIFKHSDNIFIIKSFGIVPDDVTATGHDFLKALAIEKKIKIRIIFDNSDVEKIEMPAQKRTLEFISDGAYWDKIATCGDALYIRTLVNLYSKLLKQKEIKLRSFKTRDVAIAWLKKD